MEPAVVSPDEPRLRRHGLTQPPGWLPDDDYARQERAAIQEYDGGLPSEAAERATLLVLTEDRRYCPA
jgi:hypothetical protein